MSCSSTKRWLSGVKISWSRNKVTDWNWLQRWSTSQSWGGQDQRFSKQEQVLQYSPNRGFTNSLTMRSTEMVTCLEAMS